MNCDELDGQVLGGVRQLKTRKPHQCAECLGTIETGATALTWTWLSRGSAPERIRVHPACEALALALSDCGCWVVGAAREASLHNIPDEHFQEWLRLHGTRQDGFEMIGLSIRRIEALDMWFGHEEEGDRTMVRAATEAECVAILLARRLP